jgi:hypothetical protein
MYHLANRWHDIMLRSTRRIQADVWLGRRLYGNDISLTDNLRGTFKMHWARSSSQYRSPDARKTRRHVDELRELGYTTVDRPYRAELLGRIYQQYQDKIEHEQYSIHRTRGSRMLFAPHRTIPEIKEFFNAELRQIIQDFYGAYFKVVYVGFYRNWHLPPGGQEAYSNHWHCDRMPADLLTIMINLHDITDRHGPFHIQSHRRTAQLIKRGFKDRSDYGLPLRVMEDPAHVVRLAGPAGATMICNNQWCLHRADVPAPGHVRDIGSFQVAPAQEPLPENWEESIELSVPERMFLEKNKKAPVPQRDAA